MEVIFKRVVTEKLNIPEFEVERLIKQYGHPSTPNKNITSIKPTILAEKPNHSSRQDEARKTADMLYSKLDNGFMVGESGGLIHIDTNKYVTSKQRKHFKKYYTIDLYDAYNIMHEGDDTAKKAIKRRPRRTTSDAVADDIKSLIEAGKIVRGKKGGWRYAHNGLYLSPYEKECFENKYGKGK